MNYTVVYLEAFAFSLQFVYIRSWHTFLILTVVKDKNFQYRPKRQLAGSANPLTPPPSFYERLAMLPRLLTPILYTHDLYIDFRDVKDPYNKACVYQRVLVLLYILACL